MTTKKHDWDDPSHSQHQHKEASAEGHARIKCTSHARPWTHERALEFDEEADVPKDVADLLVKNKLAEHV